MLHRHFGQLASTLDTFFFMNASLISEKKRLISKEAYEEVKSSAPGCFSVQ
jgi:hypothetical protein